MPMIIEKTMTNNTMYIAQELHTYDLSHPHSHILGFQINPVSHLLFSINSLHSHLHFSLFQHCLLLQTLASNFYVYIL